jgi:hypothetical protein
MNAQQIGAMPWTQQATPMQARQLPMQSTSVLGAQQETGFDLTAIMNLMLMMMVMVMMMKMMSKVTSGI